MTTLNHTTTMKKLNKKLSASKWINYSVYVNGCIEHKFKVQVYPKQSFFNDIENDFFATYSQYNCKDVTVNFNHAGKTISVKG